MSREKLSNASLLMLRAGMRRTVGGRAAVAALHALAACACFGSGAAHAQSLPASDHSRVLQVLTSQERRLTAQERQLEEQRRLLEQQQALIERQREQIEVLTTGSGGGAREVQGPELDAFRDQGSLVSANAGPDQPL